ncbi:hypothetical protein XOCgx_1410 [Xanthomonas oryzae pv. oryzicola]|nr:hypothetical protein XOCgx_1410 [Xanthomonas oryzae pv. oryzicola]
MRADALVAQAGVVGFGLRVSVRRRGDR